VAIATSCPVNKVVQRKEDEWMKRKKRNAVPVEVVKNIQATMLQACEDRRLTAQVRLKLQAVARRLGRLVTKTRRPRLRIPKRLIRDVLRVMTFLVCFREEIKALAYAIMGRTK
jgi:hypothetical protein